MSYIASKAGAVLARIAGYLATKQYLPTPRLARSLSDAKGELLSLRYSYRASASGLVNLRIVRGGSGAYFRLHGMNFSQGKPVPGDLAMSCSLPDLRPGDILVVNLLEPSITLNGANLSPAEVRRINARKFIAELQLTADGQRFSRIFSHYLPFDNKPIGSDYYFGDDYVDYPHQTAGRMGALLVKRYCVGGRLLDIGCALGVYMKEFVDGGFDAYGMDISAFAIAEAAKRVGFERVRCANLERSEIPFAGEFDIFWLWDVLEHFATPEAALFKISQRAKSGSWLFLHTSNADSLAHRIFGADWEGYTDYSHHGVDRVSCSSLRAWLKQLGWEIVEWECMNIWTEGVDPVSLRLKSVFQASPELRVLLNEAELGDAIRLVARRI